MKIIKIFVVIFILIFCILIVEVFSFIFGLINEDIVPIVEETTITENEVTDKYEEWVKDYYIALNYHDSIYDGYTISLVDTNFDDVPEMFFKNVRVQNNSKVTNSYMYYYVDDTVRYSYVSATTDLKLYLDTTNNNVVWGSLYKIFSYTNDIYFYKYDRPMYGKAYYSDTDINTTELFYSRYSEINLDITSGVIYDIEEDFYDVVDQYFDNIDELSNTLNKYNKS